jgi:hypothetical protein
VSKNFTGDPQPQSQVGSTPFKITSIYICFDETLCILAQWILNESIFGYSFSLQYGHKNIKNYTPFDEV